MIGQAVGNYRITSKISEGGMGVVYLAEHALIGKAAAVKVLLPELSNKREIVERFFNEARAATAIHHPGIIEIFDFGYHTDGRAYLVMEFLNGQTLSARLATRGCLPPESAMRICRRVASAVGAAHAQGVVHRDLKPDNIFLVPDPDIAGGERAKVLDFGIAKLASPGAHGPSLRTRTGAVMGTPVYMSPEQCRGVGNVDHRTDIYALGCILFEMLCGRPPFIEKGAGELIAAHLTARPPAARSINPTISPELDALIARMLAKHPDERVQSMQAVRAELEQIGGARVHTHDGLGTGSAVGPQTQPAASPGAPTTLSSAARAVPAQTDPPPARSRRGMIAAVAGALAVAAVIVAVVATRGGDDASKQPAAASSPEGQEPAAAEKVSIALSLQPTSAVVAVDGVVTGDNPVRLPRSSTTHRIEVRADGYESKVLDVTADRDQSHTVALVERPEPKSDKEASKRVAESNKPAAKDPTPRKVRPRKRRVKRPRKRQPKKRKKSVGPVEVEL